MRLGSERLGRWENCFDTGSDETRVIETVDDETVVFETGKMRLACVKLEQWEYCFDTWSDETTVDETGDDDTRVYETRGYETVDDGTRVCDTGKMRVLAGAHDTDLDKLKSMNTLVLTFNI